MSDNSQEISPIMKHMDKQFSGVYARLDEIRDAHHDTREQMITIKANFEAHKESPVHHFSPCETSKMIDSKISGLKKLMISMLITSVLVLGGLVTALIAKA